MSERTMAVAAAAGLVVGLVATLVTALVVDEATPSDDGVTTTHEEGGTIGVGEATSCAGVASAEGSPALEVCGPDRAVVGAPVRFDLVATAGERVGLHVHCGSPAADFGDARAGVCLIGCRPIAPASGPRTVERAFEHTYTAPGRYQPTFDVNCGTVSVAHAIEVVAG